MSASTLSQITENKSRELLNSWLNKSMRVEITDGRVLIGSFLCTDKYQNIILGATQEYPPKSADSKEEARTLGLVMVPGHHIKSIELKEYIN